MLGFGFELLNNRDSVFHRILALKGQDRSMQVNRIDV